MNLDLVLALFAWVFAFIALISFCAVAFSDKIPERIARPLIILVIILWIIVLFMIAMILIRLLNITF